MHEFAITQQLVDTAIEAARTHAGETARIERISVSVGVMTGIAEESMRFYFDAITLGGQAAGAALEIRHRFATATCACCGWSAPVMPPLDGVCGACESTSLQVTGGRELSVDSIDLADDVAARPYLRGGS